MIEADVLLKRKSAVGACFVLRVEAVAAGAALHIDPAIVDDVAIEFDAPL